MNDLTIVVPTIVVLTINDPTIHDPTINDPMIADRPAPTARPIEKPGTVTVKW